jgi:hypothetical protein
MSTRRIAFRIALVLTPLMLLGYCVVAAGCDSLGTSTTTTLLGGGTSPGATTPAGATTVSSVATGATLTPGGTPITGESGNTILGKWHNSITGETLDFLPNGTVLGNANAEARGLTSTYAISGNQITFDIGGLVTVVDTFSIDGNTLTLTDTVSGESGTLQRVE